MYRIGLSAGIFKLINQIIVLKFHYLMKLYTLTVVFIQIKLQQPFQEQIV